MEHVYSNAHFSVAGTSLKATKVTVEDGFSEIDMKKMGNSAEATRKGLRKQSITASFIQDYSSGSVHETLQAALEADTVDIIVRPDGAVVGGENPQWSGTSANGNQMVLTAYNPIPSVSAHDKGEVTVTFKTTGKKLTYSVA